MPAKIIAKPRLPQRAIANHCLSLAFGSAIPICGAVEETDRVVLAVFGDVMLSSGGVTKHAGAS